MAPSFPEMGRQPRRSLNGKQSRLFEADFSNFILQFIRTVEESCCEVIRAIGRISVLTEFQIASNNLEEFWVLYYVSKYAIQPGTKSPTPSPKQQSTRLYHPEAFC